MSRRLARAPSMSYRSGFAWKNQWPITVVASSEDSLGGLPPTRPVACPSRPESSLACHSGTRLIALELVVPLNQHVNALLFHVGLPFANKVSKRLGTLFGSSQRNELGTIGTKP